MNIAEEIIQDYNISNRNSHVNTLWSDDYEKICDSIRQNSVLLGSYHKKRYLYLKYILQFFRIPVIILSGLNSVISVGVQNFVQQQTISVITCVISFVCSMVGSIELYLQIQTQMDNELSMSKEFYMLSIEIYKCLSLERHHRILDGKSFLEEKFSIYEKLIESSGVINQKITDKLTPLPAKLKSRPSNILPLNIHNINDIISNTLSPSSNSSTNPSPNPTPKSTPIPTSTHTFISPHNSSSSLIPLSFSSLTSFLSQEIQEEDESDDTQGSNV
jgi:hypothetical protein